MTRLRLPTAIRSEPLSQGEWWFYKGHGIQFVDPPDEPASTHPTCWIVDDGVLRIHLPWRDGQSRGGFASGWMSDIALVSPVRGPLALLDLMWGMLVEGDLVRHIAWVEATP